MTEEEAKTKWCPMTRNPPGYEGAGITGHCIGSACMMWRVDPDEEIDRDFDGVECGYCGLAGNS